MDCLGWFHILTPVVNSPLVNRLLNFWLFFGIEIPRFSEKKGATTMSPDQHILDLIKMRKVIFQETCQRCSCPLLMTHKYIYHISYIFIFIAVFENICSIWFHTVQVFPRVHCGFPMFFHMFSSCLWHQPRHLAPWDSSSMKLPKSREIDRPYANWGIPSKIWMGPNPNGPRNP